MLIDLLEHAEDCVRCRGYAFALVAKEFFVQISDALAGFLPRAHRSFHHQTGSRNLKVWYRSWHEHYEVQLVSGAVLRAAGRKGAGESIEVGFHAEHPRPKDNDAALALIAGKEKAWRRALGREAELGPFLGRREIRDRWRRVSELWDGPGLDTDEAAVEAAERLAAYIRTLEPLLVRTPGACACWKAG